MITPIELQNKTFRAGFGYDKKDVEGFVEELQKDYEHLYKENMELNDKIHVLNEGLTYYKTVEKTIQKALVLAEKTAEETKDAARQKAHAIELEAKASAQIIIADAKVELNHLREETIQLMRQYESYKAQFKHLAAAQLEVLESDVFHMEMGNLELFKGNIKDSKLDNSSNNENLNKIESLNKNESISKSKNGLNLEETVYRDEYKDEVAATNVDNEFEFLDIE